MAAYAATAHAYAATRLDVFFMLLVYTSGVGITRDVVFVTPEGLNRMIHVLRVTYNTLITQWKCQRMALVKC